MNFEIYWNPLHPAVGLRDTIRTLTLYYLFGTVLLALFGVEVLSLQYSVATSVCAVLFGCLKAWQRSSSPLAPGGDPFGKTDDSG